MISAPPASVRGARSAEASSHDDRLANSTSDSITTDVVLVEVLFASLSSWLLASADQAPRTLAGGALIMLASLLAALRR